MKFRPTACWRMRTSPAPGAGPPTLCTRTALVISGAPSTFSWHSPAPKRIPSRPSCQLDDDDNLSDRLLRSVFAVTFGQDIEQLDRRRKRDGEVDVAAGDMKSETIRYQRHADQHQKGQRQHLGGRM